MDKELEEIKEKLIYGYKNIYDPEIPVNIYDLGLIYDIRISKNDDKISCDVDMTLTSPGCSVADVLVDQVKFITSSTKEIDFPNVNLVFEPAWNDTMMSEDAKEILAATGAAMF